jgi:hypothetical protein
MFSSDEMKPVQRDTTSGASTVVTPPQSVRRTRMTTAPRRG